jgi:hypothetical protein
MANGQELRNVRAQEPYLMYDSIVVGPGAAGANGAAGITGWYNTWAELAANADKLEWFGVKRTNVPDWASNTAGEREDFSLYIYQAGLEIILPPGAFPLDQSGVDAGLYPLMIPWSLMTYLSLTFTMANVDTTLKLPASHAPASTGLSGAAVDGVAGPVVYPGSSGVPAVQNSWRFAEPWEIPRQGNWRVNGKIERPLTGFLANLPGPFSKQIVVPPAPGSGTAPTVAEMPNWTVLRMWMRGYRRVQLRGARSVG